MPSERRLHPASILFAAGSQLRVFALPWLLAVFTAGSVGWGWELWLPLLVVPYFLSSAVRYLSYRYRYEAKEMVIRTGLLFRRERHLPYARIQNLQAVQNLFHRLLGVVEVRVETGGGEEPEATMRVLPFAAFEEMRRLVAAAKGEAVAAADAESPAAAELSAAGTTLLHLPLRELLLHGLIENRGTVLLAAAFGFAWEVGFLDGLMGRYFGEEEAGRGLVREVAGAFVGQGGLPWGRIGVAAAALVGALLLLRLLSMAWAALRLGGFRLSLEGDELRAEYGLFTRVAATIPRRRVQTVTIRESPLQQLFGRLSVAVETAGGDGGEEGKKRKESLAPILRREELPAFLCRVLPEVELGAVAWSGVDPRAFRRALKGWTLVAVGLCLPFAFPLRGWTLALLPLLLAWAAFNARRYVDHLGWAVTDGAILFKSGWLWKKVSIARFSKVQAVTLSESPFDRRRAMARLRVDSAGAAELSHRVDIPYLSRAIAEELYDRVAAQAARTAFRW